MSNTEYEYQTIVFRTEKNVKYTCVSKLFDKYSEYGVGCLISEGNLQDEIDELEGEVDRLLSALSKAKGHNTSDGEGS